MVVAVTTQQELELDVRMIPLSEIRADINIREVDRESERFKELVLSVKEKGVLEPVLARPYVPDGYQLVAGYWRLYAAFAAGLKEIPARVKDLNDAQVIEVQLVENLQRADMNEIDEARAFKVYLDLSKATQAELAKKIGKSQPYIANRMRLLELTPEAQAHIRDGIITASHGEVLLRIPKEISTQQIALVKGARARNLTVEGLRHEVDQVVAHHREQLKVEKLVAEFPAHAKCPKCGAKPRRISYYGSDFVECASFHTYNIKTGKTREEEWREQNRRTRGASRSGRSKRRGPPPEPRTWRSAHSTPSMARALLKAAADADVTGLRLESRYGTQGVELVISLKRNPVKGLAIAAEPHSYSTGEKSRVEVAGFGGTPKAVRAAFENWVKTSLPRVGQLKASTKKVDPKILDGPAAKVAQRLPANEELLEAVRELEMKGKRRKAVLAVIDLQLRVGHRSRFN